jgi:PPOX class probable F420-dependent enzyme
MKAFISTLCAITVFCNSRLLYGRYPHSWYNRTGKYPHCVEHKGIAMPRQSLAPFVGQRYLNLESFKRDGTPVQTPVWFAEEQGVLYIYTLANAGKVKRIRRNPHIRLAPCTMRGTVIGPWVEAEATIVDATTAAHGHAVLRHKYGWMKRIGDLCSCLVHRERVVIAIRVLA